MKHALTHEELDALGIPRGDDEGTYKLEFRRRIAESEAEFAAKYGCRLTSRPLHVKN